jgi:hypothetical protein
MKRFHPLALLIAALAFTSGCRAPLPSETEIGALDYGAPPVVSEIVPTIRSFLRYRLKDPDSARIRLWDVVQKTWVKQRGFSTQKRLEAGYIVTADINAKNSYGAYVGNETWRFLFRNGVIVLHSTRPDFWD